MLPSPAGFFFVMYGGAGMLGTYALWMICFGFWSGPVRIGLIAGVVAMLPLLVLPMLTGTVPALWIGPVAAYLLMLSPVVIALAWFFLFSASTLRRPQSLRETASGILAVTVTLVIPLMAIFAPVWATPVARLWYESGFEEDVSSAIAALNTSGQVCIYDDSRHLFVSSAEQLDSATMIERAVRDHTPAIRLNGLQRDPHFRVYARGQTYYWSFRASELHVFRGDRWTLEHTIEKSCAALRQDPRSLQQAYMSRGSFLPTEATLCCEEAID